MESSFLNDSKSSKTKLRKRPHQILFQTCRDYAENTTAHGFSYILSSVTVGERILWSIVVILALAFTTIQMTTLYMEWQNDPVITTLDTVALPIEEVDFPAVTICPQGSVHGILDAVLFKQFKEYVKNKKNSTYTRKRRSAATGNSKASGDEWHLDTKQLVLESEQFLADVYPGAKAKPTKLVSLLSTSEPQKMIENEAIIQPNGDEDDCDPSENDRIVNDLNRNLNNDFCPDGFENTDGIGCIHSSKVRLSYEEAKNYCIDQNGASLMSFETYQELKAIQANKLLGKSISIISTKIGILSTFVIYISIFNVNIMSSFSWIGNTMKPKDQYQEVQSTNRIKRSTGSIFI